MRPIDLIRRLLQYPKAELFIYFDFNSVNRFAGKRPGVDPLFEALFGCNDFYNAPAERLQPVDSSYTTSTSTSCGQCAQWRTCAVLR